MDDGRWWLIVDGRLLMGIINDPHDQGKGGGSKVLKAISLGESSPAPPPTSIRKIQNNEFDPYIKSLGDVYNKYQLNRALGLQNAIEGTPILSLGMDAASPSFANLDEITSRLGLAPAGKKGQPAGSPSRPNLRPSNAPALETVPKIFMESDFTLSNPHTFAVVCENGDITSPTNAGSTTTNGILQEKLSHYLDTVEVHLLREISRRSSSFFAALANLQALHQETQSCVAQIGALRKKLSNVSRTNAKQGVEVVRLKRRRGNIGVLYGVVTLVAEVRQTQPMIQLLLEQRDYVAALDMIEHTSTILRGSDAGRKGAEEGIERSNLTEGVQLVRRSSVVSQNLDLRRVRALGSFSAQLLSLSRTIGATMEAELVNIILSDVQETIATMDASKTSARIRGAPAATWVKNMLNSTYSYSVGTPVATTIDTAFIAGEERLKTRLLPLVLGLLRMDRLGSAMQSYKDALHKEIKLLSKKYYPSTAGQDVLGMSPVTPFSPNSDKNPQQSALARLLRSLSFEAFYDLLLMVYISLLHVIQRVSIAHEIIVQIVKEAQDRGVVIGADSAKGLDLQSADTPPTHPNKLRKNLSEDEDELGSTATLDIDNPALGMGSDPRDALTQSTDVLDAGTSSTYGQIISESSDVLFSACDLTHARCAKLIGVRSDQNAQLSPGDFFRLFGATWEFVVGGESLCGRMCFGLKGTILSQAKAFINRFHEDKAKQIAHIIETEQWAQAEVPYDFQDMVNQYFQSTSPITLDGSDESLNRRLSDDEAVTPSSASSPSTSAQKLDAASRTQQYLMIDRRRYNVVTCVLLFLKMLTEYMHCMESIPTLTTDVLNRIADALKLFNSRTCQVILGAGAMRSAGLKNISAKHIALTAQALGVVIAIIPHIKDGIQKFLPPKQHVLLGDFDRLLRDYKDHQSELYTKLISIMEEFCITQSERLQAIDWDNPDPALFSQTEGASVPMLEIVKQTVTLHKVLARYLPQETMKNVLLGVFKAYNQCIGDKLKNVDLFTGAGKNRLLIDVQHLIQKLSALDGVDGPGTALEVAVNNIKIKDRRTAAAPPGTSNPNNRGGTPTPRSSSEQTTNTTQSPQSATAAAANAAANAKKGNFASAFGSMLKNKNAGLPGAG
ncbi:Vps54-like protein-domain-containing protein [Fimicolochytrium jonesii]|uniref:Vps54-like protein-domain-containing protein n=1 Tax=Fimicolochytrium jonesii TaxID=1396493 RepID=UPI0022FE05AB|nr:Vps54-like protein-domain-containing protein [Fimicolochytrium jonesii]KAI8824862.1 Vps54-like protein-domain-containing protein [Fimicolochytrium jonesii]